MKKKGKLIVGRFLLSVRCLANQRDGLRAAQLQILQHEQRIKRLTQRLALSTDALTTQRRFWRILMASEKKIQETENSRFAKMAVRSIDEVLQALTDDPIGSS